MEAAVLLTGIGGQGVQLAARTLAVAGVQGGLEVMVFGNYGGLMRGGNTDATVILADGPLRSPPTVSRASTALVMHHEFWPGVRARLLADGIAVIDRSVFTGDLDWTAGRAIEIEATTVATEMGNARGGAMVALGALAGATGLVELEHLTSAAQEVLPPYRAEHAKDNATALAAGYALIDVAAPNRWSAAVTS